MKTILLWTAALAAVAVPAALWASRLVAGLPFAAYLYDAGRLLALTGAVILLIQYGLGSGFRWLERGIGLDRLIRAHRVLGASAVGIILSHPVLIVLSERLQGHSSPMGLFRLLGVSALIAVLTAAGAAMAYGKLIRRYETWKTAHLAAYAVLPLVVVHSLAMGSDLRSGPLLFYWFGLAAVFVALMSGKIIRRLQIRRRPYRVASLNRENHDTWTITLEGEPFAYRPGQFMRIRIEMDGKVTASHPFTICSSPSRDGIAATIKSVGDFTAAIGRIKPGAKAYVDAPFGAFSYLNHDARDPVFIAGGIGITPFMSMLRHLLDNDPAKKILLIWGNKTKADIVFQEELDGLASAMPHLKVVHVLSRENDWPGEAGHIDVELLKRHVSDTDQSRFFVCGPPAFTASIRAALAGLGVSKDRIHSERFAL